MLLLIDYGFAILVTPAFVAPAALMARGVPL